MRLPIASSACAAYVCLTSAPIRAVQGLILRSAYSSNLSAMARTQANVKVLGVCGGIGSGKSEACRLLVNDLDCWAHLEADKIAHCVYQPGSKAIDEITTEFGNHLLATDGTIDRRELAKAVFSSPEKMSQLEQIVWPYAKREIQRQIESYNSRELPEGKQAILILEAAVLLDAGWDDLLDALWVIQVPQEMAIARLTQQRGFSHEDAKKRIEAQESRRGIGNLQDEIEAGLVSSVITNDGSVDELREKLKAALQDPKQWYLR